jgi:hypothetical protein
MKEYITAKEVASRLGRDVSSVHKWLRRSKVKPVRKMATDDSRGQTISFFDKDTIDRMVKDRFEKGKEL